MELHHQAIRVAPCAGAWIEMEQRLCVRLENLVAPCAGAWIEIGGVGGRSGYEASLPARERGLKYVKQLPYPLTTTVAPCAGAWIEIVRLVYDHFQKLVAPCAGAWIEIFSSYLQNVIRLVAPCAGAWIEIRAEQAGRAVHPESLPARERGLKCQQGFSIVLNPARRSLRGSVD